MTWCIGIIVSDWLLLIPIVGIDIDIIIIIIVMILLLLLLQIIDDD
jgi:hypothetical protein